MSLLYLRGVLLGADLLVYGDKNLRMLGKSLRISIEPILKMVEKKKPRSQEQSQIDPVILYNFRIIY